jgi:coenzyme F420-reducing hydrogenase delta subunit/formate hydrogenlyase subunit 6/NADH:ubiquinone oxidoreductase subunit I
VIRSDQFDHHFVQEILAEPGGEHLLTCWSCGTCASTCLVRRYEPNFNPRLILHKAGLGLRDEVLCCSEIWQCSACDACYPRCPKEIHISDVMKAIRNIAIREGYERPGVTAQVDVASCIACGMCVAACPYEAISLKTVSIDGSTKLAAQVDPALCMACGICNSVCLSSSISVDGYTDTTINDSFVDGDRGTCGEETRTLVITCNWCINATADLDYAASPPEGVKMVNVPCSGRVTPLFVTTALQRGIDGVLIVGCKEGECHYKHGNALEMGRAVMLQNLLSLLGIERERVRFSWLGALDRGKFPELVDQVVHNVQALGPLKWCE